VLRCLGRRETDERNELNPLNHLDAGRPLDAGTRQRMEGVLRQDFSRVRVHTGAEAAALAAHLSARAVTMGEDIAFAPGEYRPGTPVGDAILAHELAHVVQQRGAPVESSGEAVPEGAGSPLEREAEGAAAGVLAALWARDRRGARPFVERARPTRKSPRRFQRCGYTVERPPHKFNSCGFSTSGGGSLKVDPTAAAVEILSPTFRASGEVSISGGTDAQARDWEVGFVQTVIASRRRGEYLDAARAHGHYLQGSLSKPTRDAVTEFTRLPWYAASDAERFPATGSTVKTRMDDTPSVKFPWRFAGEQLAAVDGGDQFCAWLAVCHRSTTDPVCLNWVTWEVDWTTALDPERKTGKATGSGMRVTASGDGQGDFTPVTDGPRAGTVIKESTRWLK
jgi:hypothetical protein